MQKPLLYDVFSGAGGAAKGYQRAGFRVIGIDNRPQPRYCGDGFIQMNALEFLRRYLTGEYEKADVIHASPPCQAFTNARVIHGREHHDLLTPVRELLIQIGKPWVIENVPGAPMRADILLCGSMFGEPRLKRHRLFELSTGIPAVLLPPCNHDNGNIISVFGHGGHIYHGKWEWEEVMGIDWMTKAELAQAIPPSYTEWIGRRLMEIEWK